jgi:hypothetical protein
MDKVSAIAFVELLLVIKLTKVVSEGDNNLILLIILATNL